MTRIQKVTVSLMAWAALLLVAAPIAILLGAAIELLAPSLHSAAIARLVTVYSWIPFIWSDIYFLWAIRTMDVLVVGIPYAAIVVGFRKILAGRPHRNGVLPEREERNGNRGMYWLRALWKWGVVLVGPAPIVLIYLRLLYSVGIPRWFSGDVGPTGPERFALGRYVAYPLLELVSYGVISLLIASALCTTKCREAFVLWMRDK
jgi:hypothetical protein